MGELNRDRVWRLMPGLSIRVLHDGCAVLDSQGEAAHVLNASAALVLDLCDGCRSEAQIGEELRALVPGLGAERARADVRRCLEELQGKGLIES